MTRYELQPSGWPCRLEECPPGHFLCDGELSFKTEYRSSGHIEVFSSTGERLWAGKGSHFEVGKVMVQPVVVERIEEEAAC